MSTKLCQSPCLLCKLPGRFILHRIWAPRTILISIASALHLAFLVHSTWHKFGSKSKAERQTVDIFIENATSYFKTSKTYLLSSRIDDIYNIYIYIMIYVMLTIYAMFVMSKWYIINSISNHVITYNCNLVTHTIYPTGLPGYLIWFAPPCAFLNLCTKSPIGFTLGKPSDLNTRIFDF